MSRGTEVSCISLLCFLLRGGSALCNRLAQAAQRRLDAGLGAVPKVLAKSSFL